MSTYGAYKNPPIVIRGEQTEDFVHVLFMVDGTDYGWWDHGRRIGGEREIVIS